jgi:hypothetical protein
VYRTYRKDVSRITDVVRGSVYFPSAVELAQFVDEWVMKYGVAHQAAPKRSSIFQHLLAQVTEFINVYSEFMRSSVPTANISDDDSSKLLHNCETSDSIETDAQKEHEIKAFEILRIRNRFDPALIDVPGGYRDLALKLKIGFMRCTPVFFVLSLSICLMISSLGICSQYVMCII